MCRKRSARIGRPGISQAAEHRIERARLPLLRFTRTRRVLPALPGLVAAGTNCRSRLWRWRLDARQRYGLRRLGYFGRPRRIAAGSAKSERSSLGDRSRHRGRRDHRRFANCRLAGHGLAGHGLADNRFPHGRRERWRRDDYLLGLKAVRVGRRMGSCGKDSEDMASISGVFAGLCKSITASVTSRAPANSRYRKSGVCSHENRRSTSSSRFTSSVVAIPDLTSNPGQRGTKYGNYSVCTSPNIAEHLTHSARRAGPQAPTTPG